MGRLVIGRRLAAVSLALFLPACASAPPASLVQARGDVGEAINAPPDTYSRAELDEAKLKVGQAEAAAKNDNMSGADALSQEALADLRLSKARAQTQQAQKASNDMQATIDSLHQAAESPLPSSGGTATPSPQPSR